MVVCRATGVLLTLLLHCAFVDVTSSPTLSLDHRQPPASLTCLAMDLLLSEGHALGGWGSRAVPARGPLEMRAIHAVLLLLDMRAKL